MVSLILLIVCASILLLLRLVYNALASPLRDVPGPFLARFTRAWYFLALSHGDFQNVNIRFHQKYGKIVRIAPNQFSIEDPEAAKVIMGYGANFKKADWYRGWASPDPHRYTIFTDQDIKRHHDLRRNVQTFYSMSSIVSYETYVDDCGKLLLTRLRELCDTGTVVDMGEWLQFYAFDVISMITSSQRMGFLDSGKDVNQLLSTLYTSMIYSTLIGVFPEFIRPTYPIVNRFVPAREFIIKFSQDQIRQKRATFSTQSSKEDPMDMLTKMFHTEAEKESFPPYAILERTMGNIVAGSDTTASSLSSVLFHLIANPLCMGRLRSELQNANISNPLTWKESQELPYLQAVIKEGLRVFPAVGLPMWRDVPKGGATICGRHFPEGTTVGISAWTAHSNTTIFGPDADHFRPERWLDSSPSQIAAMDRYNLSFGMGSRTCLGMHVSKLEMAKVIPRLVTEFDFVFEGGDEKHGMETKEKQELRGSNFWFVRPVGFRCRVVKRV